MKAGCAVELQANDLGPIPRPQLSVAQLSTCMNNQFNITSYRQYFCISSDRIITRCFQICSETCKVYSSRPQMYSASDSSKLPAGDEAMNICCTAFLW